MSSQKRFLAFFSRPAGDVIVDAGAERALVEHGRSLLPSGIVEVKGRFEPGDTVRVLNGEGAELGRGISNYSAAEVLRIKGRKSAEVRAILGYDACYDEVVHRSYMVVTR